MSKSYDASSIKLLRFPTAIRKRPGMYIGSTDKLSNGTNPAIYQITKEVLDNAVDEHLSKHANRILIKISKNEITIADNGRGIPIEYHKEFKASTLVGVFSNMHASGKFDKDSYDTAIGTNGVGSKCTNALSTSFKVWTNRSNKWYSVAFKQGKLVQDIKKSICPIKGWDGGTVVSFIPDESILQGKLDFEKLHSTAKILSYITSAYITLEKDGKSKTYHSKRGLLDYLDVMNKKQQGSMSEAFSINKDGVNLAMCWIDKDTTIIESFVNASPTRDGGTHVKGLQKAVSDAFKQVYKKANFDWQDISSGLLCVLAKNVSEVKFDSQTKDRLITKEAEKETYDVVFSNLVKWIKRNQEFCDDLVSKAEKLKALRSKTNDERAVLKALKGKRGKSDLPPTKKFAISTTKNPEERTLFVVEGDSASGACKNVRNPKIHEILALRGKILNVIASDKKVFESEEVVNILKAIGFNEKGTWRVGKVVIFCDADPDGAHISSLVLGVLATVCPKLIKEGRVYVVDAPLFIGKTSTTEYYGNDLSDLYRQSKAITSITRVKGWGECPAPVLKKIVFSEDSKFKQIQFKDSDYIEIKKIMGSNGLERKALLELLK